MATPKIEIDICKLLIENKFLKDTSDINIKTKLQLKSALCLRLLLFFDGLHDFMDTARIVTAFTQIKNNTNNEFGEYFNEHLPSEYRTPEFRQRFKKAKQSEYDKRKAKKGILPVSDTELQSLNKAANTANAELGDWMYNKLIGKTTSESEIASFIARELFIKLLRDLNDIFQNINITEPSGTNLYILKELVVKMNFFITSPQEMGFLKINSIFYNTMADKKQELMSAFRKVVEANPEYVQILKDSKGAPDLNMLKNKFFLYSDHAPIDPKRDTPVGKDPPAEIYLYPTIFLYMDAPKFYTPKLDVGTHPYLNGLKNNIEGKLLNEVMKDQDEDEDEDIDLRSPNSIGFFISKGVPRGRGALKEPALNLMNFIKSQESESHESDNNDVNNFPIYIIVILLYFWDRKTILVSSDKKNDVHIFYFRYILEFALNCYEYKPKLHALNKGDFQTIHYINLILKYLCYQDPSLLPDITEEEHPCLNNLNGFLRKQILSR